MAFLQFVDSFGLINALISNSGASFNFSKMYSISHAYNGSSNTTSLSIESGVYYIIIGYIDNSSSTRAATTLNAVALIDTNDKPVLPLGVVAYISFDTSLITLNVSFGCSIYANMIKIDI